MSKKAVNLRDYRDSRDPLAGFLRRCHALSLKDIDLTIQSGKVDTRGYDFIKVVPYLAVYEELGNPGRALRTDFIDSICYARSDKNFTTPIESVFDLGNPFETLRMYGEICAKRCYQSGFETRLFTSFHPNNSERALVPVDFEGVRDQPRVEVPAFVIL